MCKALIYRLGDWSLRTIRSWGLTTWICLQALRYIPLKNREAKIFFSQIAQLGWQSLNLIVVAGFFIGTVLILQMHYTLATYGATSQSSSLLVIALLRELGPVLTALLYAGSAGSAITSAIGLMKATEQLESLAVMAINPIQEAIATRFWATFVCLPVLLFSFVAAGIWGGGVVATQMLHLDPSTFWSNLVHQSNWSFELQRALLKASVFGWVIALIAIRNGYYGQATTPGISQAVTKTVVQSALAVLALDCTFTAFLY